MQLAAFVDVDVSLRILILCVSHALYVYIHAFCFIISIFLRNSSRRIEGLREYLKQNSQHIHLDPWRNQAGDMAHPPDWSRTWFVPLDLAL